VSLPLFPDFRLIDLEDRGVIQSRLEAFPPEMSEASFANIFMWRHYDHPMLTVIHENLCILFQPPDEPAYFMQPLGASRLPETIEACLSAAPRLGRLPGSFAGQFCPAYRCQPDPDNDDYVYRTEDLAELRGKHYDGKRNRIRKFEKSHTHSYLELLPGHRDACRALLNQWAEKKDARDLHVLGQVRAIQEALEHFERLGLRGGAIEVDGRLEAFCIGEKLNPTTAVVHIEIVNPACEGLAQFINREFVRRAWPSFAFINREQDMGLAGLRKAKLSYHPHHRVEKHSLWGVARRDKDREGGTASDHETGACS
jgi:uncharacterized protein